jgi:hypothetical protein
MTSGQWSRSMHIRVVSLTWGGPMQAIRVINEERLLLILVGINIISSFGKEYVKLAWEYTGKPGQENWDF